MDWLYPAFNRTVSSFAPSEVAPVPPIAAALPMFTILAHFRQSTLPAKGIDGRFYAKANRYHPEGTYTERSSGTRIYYTKFTPGRNACMMISGYTAWAMLLGQMNTRDDLHLAMLGGISRYQDVVRAVQNPHADPLKTHLRARSSGDGIQIPVRDGDLFYSFHLHALDGLIQIDPRPTSQECEFLLKTTSWEEILLKVNAARPSPPERVAAVLNKGGSAFSVMIEPNGEVQITDSHAFSGENRVAFSKKFYTIRDAAQFLTSRHPYIPPRTSDPFVDPANTVECIPLFLPLRVQGNPQIIADFDSHYAAECLPIVRYFSPTPFL